MNNHHDVLREIIDLFVDPSRKERIVYLWEKPKRRAQLLDELLHCAGDFRDDRSTRLEPPLEDPALVAQRMRKLGAGKSCFAFGYLDFDGQEGDLTRRLPKWLANSVKFCFTAARVRSPLSKSTMDTSYFYT